jgi:hypothetical protein
MMWQVRSAGGTGNYNRGVSSVELLGTGVRPVMARGYELLASMKAVGPDQLVAITAASPKGFHGLTQYTHAKQHRHATLPSTGVPCFLYTAALHCFPPGSPMLMASACGRPQPSPLQRHRGHGWQVHAQQASVYSTEWQHSMASKRGLQVSKLTPGRQHERIGSLVQPPQILVGDVTRHHVHSWQPGSLRAAYTTQGAGCTYQMVLRSMLHSA